MEEIAVNYFQGLNFMSRRVMQDGSSIMMKYRDIWQEMSLEDREKTLNEHFIPQSVKNKYLTDAENNDSDMSECFPVLKVMGGEKILVDFDNEDGWTWRDEHSGPFSWKSRSQQDLSLEDEDVEKLKQKKPARNSHSRTPERPLADNTLFFKPEKSIWESPFLAFDKQQGPCSIEKATTEVGPTELHIAQQLVATGKASKQPLVSSKGTEDVNTKENSDDNGSSSPSPVHRAKGFVPLPQESPEHVLTRVGSEKKKNAVSNQAVTKKAWKSSVVDPEEEELVVNISLGTTSRERMSGHVSPVFIADNGESSTDNLQKPSAHDLSAQENIGASRSGFDFLDNW